MEMEKKKNKQTSIMTSTTSTTDSECPCHFCRDYKCNVRTINGKRFYLSISGGPFAQLFNNDRFCRHMNMNAKFEDNNDRATQTIFHFLMTEHHRTTLKELKAKFESMGNVKLTCDCFLSLAVIFNRIDLLEYLQLCRHPLTYYESCCHLAMLFKRHEHLRALGIGNHRLFPNNSNSWIRDGYRLPHHMCYLFDADHIQIIMTDFPAGSGLYLVLWNLSNAFNELCMERDITPFLPFIPKLMDLACIFFPSSPISMTTVISWLQIAAFCLQNHFSWIKMRHLRLWRCFSVMHKFFHKIDKPVLSVQHHPFFQILTFSHSSIPPSSPPPSIPPSTKNGDVHTSALDRFSQHPLFDIHLADVILSFITQSLSSEQTSLQPPDTFEPNIFSSWQDIKYNKNKQKDAFKTIIHDQEYCFKQTFDKQYLSNNDQIMSLLLGSLKPSYIIRYFVFRVSLPQTIPWNKIIQMFVSQDK